MEQISSLSIKRTMHWTISMKNILRTTKRRTTRMKNPIGYLGNRFLGKEKATSEKKIEPMAPINVLINKEVAAHIRSWRFIVLIVLVVLTFVASLYVSSGNLRSAFGNPQDPDKSFLYLKLLTTTDNSIPPFHVFLNFLGPLLGISLGFDAINAEQNGGTLTRLMAQPVYRDNLLLSKFVSALIVVSVLFLSLALLMMGGGLIITGVRMEPQEFLRILAFVFISVVYVAFWLSLSILLS